MKQYYFLLIIFFLTGGLFCFANSVLANVVINEIMYDPEGSDDGREWLEIFNNASSTLDLTNWRLYEQETNHKLKGDLIIPAGGYVVIVDDQEKFLIDNPGYQGSLIDSTFSLHNKGEYLALKDTDLNIIDEVTYDASWGANGNGKTLERTGLIWQESANLGGTPGAPNSSGAEESPPITPTGGGGSSPATNHPPIAQAGSDQTILTETEIVFDAEKSSDPDNDKLTFFWNFGNGQTSDQEKVSYIYKFPGTYVVTLTVSGNKLEATDSLTIYVFAQGVVINEFNPVEGWVELYNSSEQIINLENYKLNNFVFPKGSLIGPKQYLVVKLESLSNSLKLFYPNDQISQEIKFEKIKENSSINRISDQEYFWSSILTPGNANFIGRGLINQTPLAQSTNNQPIIPQEKSAPQASKNPIWSALAKSLTMQDQKPITKIALVQTKKPLISDAMGKFLLVLSIAVSFGLLASWLVLKSKRLI